MTFMLRQTRLDNTAQIYAKFLCAEFETWIQNLTKSSRMCAYVCMYCLIVIIIIYQTPIANGLVKQQIKNQYGVKMKKQCIIVITKINGETDIQTLTDNRLIYTAIRCSRILNGKKVNITRNNQTNLLKGEYQAKTITWLHLINSAIIVSN